MKFSKDSITKITIYFFAIFSCVVVLSTRVPKLGRFMTTSARVDCPGGLYLMSGLNYFSVEKDWVPPSKNPKLEDAQVIVFGDSFTEQSFGKGTFHMGIQRNLDVPVYWQIHRSQTKGLYYTPLDWLKEEKPQSLRRAKVLIMVRVDRGLYRVVHHTPRFSSNRDSPLKWPKRDEEEKAAGDLASLIYDNSKIEYVVKNSFFTRGAFESIASARFIITGKTSDLVPKYSVSPRMLFFGDCVEDFDTPMNPKEFQEIIRCFIGLRDRLKEQYGLTFVFVPVPNKYTIYHDYADADSVYDDFLPRLCAKLRENGVICVDLYPEFMKHRDEILYWPDDTHWNGKGIDIAVDLTTEIIRQNNLLPDSSK